MKSTLAACGLHAGAFLLAGCTTSISPGSGNLSSGSLKRLHEDERAGALANAMRAIQVADEQPQDVRATRKASELTTIALHKSESADKKRIVRAAESVVKRLAASTDVCVDATLAADVEAAADRASAAADLRVRAADSCHSPKATLRAARALRMAQRCTEAVRVVERGFNDAPSSSWIGLMDAVAECSNNVSLRQNLAFVPVSVREDYFALLAERQRQKEREEEAAALQQALNAQAERRERQRSDARARCTSHCSSAESSCFASCGGSGPCISRCNALSSSCLAGCQ